MSKDKPEEIEWTYTSSCENCGKYGTTFDQYATKSTTCGNCGWFKGEVEGLKVGTKWPNINDLK